MGTETRKRRAACAIRTVLGFAASLLLASSLIAAPPMEVLHVPAEDMPHIVGPATEGVTLPLGEILDLVAKAEARGEVSAQVSGVSVTSFALEGTAGECLEFAGDMVFANSSAQRAALRIGAPGIAWTEQSIADGVDAHLVRWSEGMWLVAGPGAKGTLRLGFSISPDGASSWMVPALDVPVRMRLVLPGGVEPVSVDAPSRVAAEGGGLALEIWPALRHGTRINLRRTVPLDAPQTLRASVRRTFAADGATLTVEDAVSLFGQFAEGQPVRLPLPANVRLLSAQTSGDAALLREADAIVLVPGGAMDAVSVAVRLVPADADMPVGSWEIAGAVRSDEVTLRASDTHVPVLAPVPPELIEADAADAAQRAWKVWGALPEMRVPLVPAIAPRPPDVTGTVEIEDDGMLATFEIHVPHTQRGSMRFDTPAGWSVVSIEASADGNPVPVDVVARGDSRHLAQWEPGAPLGTLKVTLHRALAISREGDAEVEMPRLVLDPEALNDELVATWPESLDVRTGTIAGMAIVPATELRLKPREIGNGGIALRATATHAKASLLVGRRAPDVRASVATLLSVEQDRTVVRSSIFWSVRFAAQDTFRFVLPAGIDSTAAQLEGASIRESSSRSVPEGEEWTVQTQYGVTDEFSVSLEWTMEPPAEGPVLAPAIDVRGTSAQRGWIALEASPSLRLETEVRRLAEADPAELPAVPWKTGRRLLNAWRYLRPPYELRVTPERFAPEEPLRGLVTEAELTTTITPEGERLTEARYDVMPRRERQFFEIALPKGAELWAALVDGRGEKPATRANADGTRTLLVPLPASSSAATIPVRILYRESAKKPLAASTRLKVEGPHVPVPVSRTAWNLNLPPGFEYLAFEGSFGPPVLPREPLATFLRTAYWPEKLVFEDAPLVAVAIGSIVAAAGVGLVVLVVRYARRKKMEWGLGDAKQADISAGGCGTRLIELIVVVAIVAILASIATPNFLEAQVRSKVSRSRADMRSMATAIESYYVDNNAFPPQADILWQGSVKYMASAFLDPYAEPRGTPMRYISGRDAFVRGVHVGLVSPEANPDAMWLVYSIGPDTRDDGAMVLYDPTNGTVSSGDIVRVRDVGTWEPTYGQRIAAAVGSMTSPPAHAEVPAPRSAPQENEDLLDERAGAVVRDARPGEIANWPKPAAAPLPNVHITDMTKAPASVGEEDAATTNVYRFPAAFVLGDYIPFDPDQPGAQLRGGAGAVDLAGDGVHPVIIGSFAYDPTIGTVSRGDVWRTRDGESDALSIAAEGQDLVAGASFSVDGFADSAPASGMPESPFGGAAGTAKLGFPAERPSRDAGLLSLDVEIPQGGVQRRFEGLFDEARLEIRLLDEQRFLRIRFVAQFAVFAALALLWIWHRPAFRPAFVALLAAGLLLPVAGAGPLAGFFNAAVQGCLLALAVPLVSFVASRAIRRRVVPAAAMLALLAVPALSSAQEPVRAVVTYDAAAATPLSENPDAFLDRATFERLWNAAHPGETTALPAGFAAIADLRIAGTLDVERGEIAGTIVVVGVNSGEGPQPVALALGEATLLPPTGDTKAALSSGADGYAIVLPAGGATTATLPFRLACRVVGNGGSLAITLPEAASGRLEIVLPFENASARLEGALRPVVRPAEGSCTVALPARAGEQRLSWKASAAADGAVATEGAWKVGATTRAAWSTLAFAEWSVELAFESTEREAALPPEIALPIDAGVRITGAEGDLLKGVRVDDGRVVLGFERSARANVRLFGVMEAPEGESWTIASVRPAAANLDRHVVRLEIDEAIEIPGIDPRAMQRRPPQQVPQGRALREFETADAAWALAVDLRPVRATFEALVDEVVSLVPGSPLRATRVLVQPKDSVVRSIAFDVPEGATVLDATGNAVARWHQVGTRAEVVFASAVAGPEVVNVVMRTPQDGAVVRIAPVEVHDAMRGVSSLAVAVPTDADLVERALQGATPMPPDEVHRQLLGLAGIPERSATLRAWTIAKAGTFEFELSPVERTALTSVFNRVVVSEGVQSFRAVIRSEPRRGRIDVVRARLLLARPEADAAARLDVSGPVRSVETKAVSDREILLTAHLAAPASSAVEIVVALDQPFDADAAQAQPVTVASPIDGERVQSMLLLRRDFEGQFADVDARAGRVAEASSVAWPAEGFSVRPSDLAFELPADSAGQPVFRVQRHSREQAVRAVVEVLRLRVIVTEDGFERHELEMALQNQSEQFLRVALPAPRKEIDIYEVRVADRAVDATFGTEGGRDVLLVPLIRTGLLQPELAVRVAFTVSGREPLRGGERREQSLPEILGGVPVAQSALVLMLPPTWSHSDFEGSLNRVELVDIEVDEALRRARKVEQLSQTLLAVDDVDVDGDLDMVQQAAANLGQMQTELEESLRAAGAKVEAYGREAKKSAAVSQEEQAREQRLEAERGANLDLARSSQINTVTNYAAISEKVQQQQRPQRAARIAPPPPVPAAAADPAISFPRHGEVFVFRQLQGTGSISFQSASRASRSALLDVMAVAAIAMAAGIVAFAGRRIAATNRRRTVLVATAGAACLVFGVARDIGVVLLVAGAAMEIAGQVRNRTAAGHEAA